VGNKGLKSLGHGWRAKLALVLTLSLLIGLLVTQGISTAQDEVFLSSELGKMHLDANDPIDPTVPITNPICTSWHELYPDFCNGYHLSDWEDNGDGFLSPCDQIWLTDNVTLETTEYHVDSVTVTIEVEPKPIPPGGDYLYFEWWGGYYGNPEYLTEPIYEPVCSIWHEVYPEFCSWYHLAGWIDNPEGVPDGILSKCDQIMLVDLETEEFDWYHVTEVTTDIIVSPKPPPPDPIPNPVCTMWHEIYPNYCTWHHLSDWDDNTDGVLSPCDSIELTNQTTQAAKRYHVDEVTLTMWVTNWTLNPIPIPDIPGEQSILEFEGGYTNMATAMATPVCTNWQEIHPGFGDRYHIEKWTDNGDLKLGFCDWIVLKDLATNATADYHVDDIAINIVCTEEEEEEEPPGCEG
jgi:hypothetical protein